MASHEKRANGTEVPPEITLYTNHMCPYAHRAHIALKELNLPYKEVIIDLDKPREAFYLAINPRGLVPSIQYSNGVLSDEIITESEVVTRFLCDERPSHLLPESLSSPQAPLFRARVNFIIDTYSSKIMPFMNATLLLDSEEEKEVKCSEWTNAIAKEIEPLLKDANPFFGGSKSMTLFEVQVAPFLIRAYAMTKAGLLPMSLRKSFDALPNFTKWANAVMAKESVTYVFAEAQVTAKTAERVRSSKGQAGAK